MTFSSRPVGSRHCLGALFTIALAIQLFLSSKDPYQIPKGSHHAILRNASQQYDTGLDDKSTVTLHEPEILISTFNTSLEEVDSPYAALSSQSTFTRRQVNLRQEAYNKALCKGKQLVGKVNQDFHHRITRYSVYEELEENGWTYKQINRALPNDLTAALSDLQISATEQDNVFVTLNHSKEFSNRFAAKVAPSKAVYQNYFNAHSHVIIADYNYGPSYQLKNLSPGERERRLPLLRNWSDAVWLAWKEYAGNQAGNLEYIFQHSIFNLDAKLTIKYIETVVGEQAIRGGYPGIERTFDSDDGKALLGTPNNVGVAWMLYDHRDEIQKKLDWVRVWSIPDPVMSSPTYDLVIKLKDP